VNMFVLVCMGGQRDDKFHGSHQGH
jgi:hypothetical protein